MAPKKVVTLHLFGGTSKYLVILSLSLGFRKGIVIVRRALSDDDEPMGIPIDCSKPLFVGEARKLIALIKTGKFQEAAELRVAERRLNAVQAKLVVQLVWVTLQDKMELTSGELNLKVAY
jgi:hypothetical protein